jgi:hypothetical protein
MKEEERKMGRAEGLGCTKEEKRLVACMAKFYGPRKTWKSVQIQRTVFFIYSFLFELWNMI